MAIEALFPRLPGVPMSALLAQLPDASGVPMTPEQMAKLSREAVDRMLARAMAVVKGETEMMAEVRVKL